MWKSAELQGCMVLKRGVAQRAGTSDSVEPGRVADCEVRKEEWGRSLLTLSPLFCLFIRIGFGCYGRRNSADDGNDHGNDNDQEPTH